MGVARWCYLWRGTPYLQEFDALCERRCVETGFAACSVDVALDSVVRLPTGFIEGAQVHPGSGVVVVQLNSTDVGLQRIHRLVLLLVEHPEGKGKVLMMSPEHQSTDQNSDDGRAPILFLPYGAPGVSTRLRLINGLTIGDEGILHLPNTGVAPREIRVVMI